jgi:Uma2 family endonuclease
MMNSYSRNQDDYLGPEAAGVLMTPAEYEAIEEFDDAYRYELVHGVLVVTSCPLPEEAAPNELLGYFLWTYGKDYPQGSALDKTLTQQCVRTQTTRRIADRLIWTGLGRFPSTRRDLPTIAVEFASAYRWERQRDYVDKRQDYQEAGISEYWIIDRFQRTLTVIRYLPTGVQEQVVQENETYQSPHLPGFEVPLAELLAAADREAQTE